MVIETKSLFIQYRQFPIFICNAILKTYAKIEYMKHQIYILSEASTKKNI